MRLWAPAVVTIGMLDGTQGSSKRRALSGTVPVHSAHVAPALGFERVDIYIKLYLTISTTPVKVEYLQK